MIQEGGAEENKSINQASTEIRKKLYHLKRGTGRYRVVDLGNLRNGPELSDTYLRLKEVCEHLIEKNILPIIIGGTHDFDFAQYRGLRGNG